MHHQWDGQRLTCQYIRGAEVDMPVRGAEVDVPMTVGAEVDVPVRVAEVNMLVRETE